MPQGPRPNTHHALDSVGPTCHAAAATCLQTDDIPERRLLSLRRQRSTQHPASPTTVGYGRRLSWIGWFSGISQSLPQSSRLQSSPSFILDHQSDAGRFPVRREPKLSGHFRFRKV